MHIVYVTNKLVNGGGERVLVNLIAAVRARSGTAAVLFMGRDTAIDPAIETEVGAAGASVIRLYEMGAILANLREATTIHLYNLNVYVKVLPFLPLIGKRRLICHVHGVADSANPTARKLFCRTANPCDEIVFVSETGKRSYGIDRGRVIQNPVIFPPRRNGPPPIPGAAIRMLSVNRLVGVKRIHAQIDIIATLVNRFGVDTYLDVVGEGAELQALQDRAISQGLGERVRFLGGLSHFDVITRYQDYDLFLSTSAAEGLGLSLVEALAAGLPAAASPIAAYKEVAAIGGGVLFIDPEDPSAAATTIHDALQTLSLQTASLVALSARFDTDAFQRQIFGIYK